MPCKCSDKKKETPVEHIAPTPVKANRLMMNCPGCGLMRLLPTGLSLDDIFQLVPCPKCNNAFRGRLVGEGVEEVS